MERKADDAEPFAALAFKVMTDPHMGKLTYIRVLFRRIAVRLLYLQSEYGSK